MKTLVLVRHAKSDWSMDLSDRERPLNDRGKKDAPRMGKTLAKTGFRPDLILSSPAVRAHATARAVAQELEFSGKILLEPSIYEEGPGSLYSLVHSQPDDAETVMLFGHNPTLEQFSQFLLQSSGSIVMPTCAMIALESDALYWKDFVAGRLRLRWFLVPKRIP